jgi:hypothetical protein
VLKRLGRVKQLVEIEIERLPMRGEMIWVFHSHILTLSNMDSKRRYAPAICAKRETRLLQGERI